MKYTKNPISFKEQIDKLESRGMKFMDKEKAENYLSNISYYRLRAYTYPFQENQVANHLFTKEIFFEDIVELYVFDRRLRLLLLNAIEKIEIALRTKIIYYFAMDFGSHWYENIKFYFSQENAIKDLNKLYEEIERSKEDFVIHYKQKYDSPKNPPVWMSLEVSSIGVLSRLFANLKNCSQKRIVAKYFGLNDPSLLVSWIQSFTVLRNTCAHHSRVWNRRFANCPKLPKNPIYPFVNREIHSNKLYAQICCIQYLLKIISPASAFQQKLKKLISLSNLVTLKEMGFPIEWEKEPLWQ